jgi:uncharacterized membrane protein YhaH (DUF805 family)
MHAASVLCIVAVVQALRRGLGGATVNAGLLRIWGAVAAASLAVSMVYMAVVDSSFRSVAITNFIGLGGAIAIIVGASRMPAAQAGRTPTASTQATATPISVAAPGSAGTRRAGQSSGVPVLHWYFDVLKKYVVFSGRARRREYWCYSLVSGIIIVALLLLDLSLGTIDTSEGGGLGVISGLYVLAVFLPTLAVTVRRLHDQDNSGWWVLISFVPFGGLVLLVFMFRDSDPDTNLYGPSPKPGVGPMKPLA